MDMKLYIYLFLFVILITFGKIFGDDKQQCVFHKEGSDKKELLLRLMPLYNQKFTCSHGGKNMVVTICGEAYDKLPSNASVIEETGKDLPPTVTVLGRRTDTDISGSDSWILLTYGFGDKYTEGECKGNRSAVIMITCMPGVNKPILKFIEYNDQLKDNCHYLFELKTSLMCPPAALEHYSNGSIFCILFFTSLLVYLIGGMLCKRFFGGAKGIEQIPHHYFWKKLGSLQADGCNFVCRCDDTHNEPWQRITHNFNENEDRDDTLLRP